MKNSWQILTLILALALLTLTIRDTIGDTIKSSKESDTTPIDAEQVGIDLIMSRSSIRSYTSQEVPQPKIEALLKAGMAAPTAGNRQPWDFIVVRDRATLDKFPDIIAGSHMATKAQLAIVVCGTPARAMMDDYWVQDCSAATENILLAAHAMGLGAVWCGAYPNNAENRVAQMRELLSIPEESYALNIIVIGYPDSEPQIKDKWNPERVHYNSF